MKASNVIGHSVVIVLLALFSLSSVDITAALSGAVLGERAGLVPGSDPPPA